MTTISALAPINFAVAWALAFAIRDQFGRAIYSLKVNGQLVGRVVQCRRADSTGGTGFMVEVYRPNRTDVRRLRNWTEVQHMTRRPSVVFGGTI